MRCVHLDFHTSPDIDGIGAKFDKQKFTETLKNAKVDLVTVFAKCHHGYTYYPSKVGTMHPHLKFNLLKEEIEAIHEAGAKAPIYITAGWCKKDADEHPEWHQIDFYTKKPLYMGAAPSENDDPDAPLEHCTWTGLCLAGGYKQYIEALTREVCESFDVSDGIFYDICFFGDNCVCESCQRGMRERGLNPDNIDDVRAYFSEGRIRFMKDMTAIVHEYAPNACYAPDRVCVPDRSASPFRSFQRLPHPESGSWVLHRPKPRQGPSHGIAWPPDGSGAGDR